MKKGITAGDQEQQCNNNIQQNDEAFGKFPQRCHGRLKLQIFLFCCPPQNVFFFTGKIPISLLIYFI